MRLTGGYDNGGSYNIMRAGSLVSANNLYNVAPKDGSTFGAFARNIPQTPAIETTGVRQNV
jgi:hypothetical protein